MAERTAREELYYWFGPREGRDSITDLIDEILTRHAHELAEKQRAAIKETDDPIFYEGEAGWLPDLIDPEVSE